ncbi:hypothetical protein J6590_028131 [Homalodisca vitripennis]|nr:hypothetical protein J6590_028131 [Homalodisca vitripennis]
MDREGFVHDSVSGQEIDNFVPDSMLKSNPEYGHLTETLGNTPTFSLGERESFIGLFNFTGLSKQETKLLYVR